MLPVATVPDAVEMVDRGILLAVDRGEPRRALDLLMSTYGDRVYAYCRRFLRDDALAEDVLQDVFLQAYRGLPRFRRESRIVCWLLGIAHHRCLDASKAKSRHDQHFAPCSRDAPDSPEESTDPADLLDTGRIRAALEECLARLAPHVRMAVLLHFNEGLSFEEMSRILGEKAATLQARVARAMPVLRVSLLSKGVRPDATYPLKVQRPRRSRG